MPENPVVIQKWIRIAFINLLIVALLGVIMRYKIAYYLPLIEQENFLHAHSHFAFSGWASQVLMILLWGFLSNYLPNDSLKKYKWILLANLLCAYGMLASFLWDGYGIMAILFSNLSIAVSYSFAIIFWVDLNKIKIKIISPYWFKAALLFNVLSSFGAFFLSYMITNKIHHPNWFLSSTYYYLHFQYNGWFLFACMGLLSEYLASILSFSLQKIIFWLFALACIPAYFLSALWLPIPLWVYIAVVLAAAAELLGWILLLKTIMQDKTEFFKNLSTQTKGLLILSATALTIKLLLQLGSTIPFLSKLAFGFRPVVIGYLHLMFLGVVSLFIIGFCKMNKFIITARAGNTGIIIFVSGIILNEILLMIQGLSYMNYISVPYINQLLLGAAACMFSGIFLLVLELLKRNQELYNSPKFILDTE
ncbi:MAG: hypothetical protein ABIN97_19645 [Ginsengibacter sp.]